MSSHLIPNKLISGVYDDNYLGFLEERSKSIFILIQRHVIDARANIQQEFYQEPFVKNRNLRVFAKFNRKDFEATFNLKTGEIVFNGQRYTSVSSAAVAVKKQVTGKDRAVNGWEFWKYLDEQSQEKIIATLREHVGSDNTPQLNIFDN
ncbi:MAG: hypothetical protein NT070_20585 [Cyanobacteria bacterium]|nr:hypothetical protein [Cyanobacteriota bacterium]